MLCYQEDGSFAVDNSGRESWKRCDLQWWLRSYLGRTTSEIKKDLYAGTCLHTAWAQMYNGVPMDDIMAHFDETYGEWARGKLEVKDGKAWQNLREVLWECMQRRLNNPPYQPVKDWIEFPISYLLAPGVTYTGRIDAIVEAEHGFGGEDTKSTGQPSEPWCDQFTMSDQLTGYYDGMREQHNWDIPNWYINIIHAKALPAEPEKKCTTHSKGKRIVKWGDCWPQHNDSRAIGPYLRDPAQIPAFRQAVVADVEDMKRLIDIAPTIQDIDKVNANGKLSPRIACERCEFKPYCFGGVITPEKVMANTVEVFWDPRDATTT